MPPTGPDEARFAPALEAYRRAKWAELADEGEGRLLRELAQLEVFLANEASGTKEWWGAREMEVDVPFRQAKARVLRGIISEARRARD